MQDKHLVASNYRARGRRSDVIVSRIKDMIHRGVVKPGDRLPSERDLALDCGVSRPAVREAMNQLAALGFIEVRRAQGTFVRPMTPATIRIPLQRIFEDERQNVLEILDLRAAVEGWAAAQAARRASPDQIRLIQQIVAEIEIAADTHGSLVELDSTFHRAIVEAAQNSILSHFIDTLMGMIASVKSFKRMLPAADHGPEIVTLFREISNAIATRNAEEAQRAMVAHLESVRHRLMQFNPIMAPAAERSVKAKSRRAGGDAGALRASR
jgi:GntR family transcriptional repressor for pyruvate dehydrogenase complex